MEVMVAENEVVSNGEEGGAEGMVAMAYQRSIGVIDEVTLIAGRPQAGAAADRRPFMGASSPEQGRHPPCVRHACPARSYTYSFWRK